VTTAVLVSVGVLVSVCFCCFVLALLAVWTGNGEKVGRVGIRKRLAGKPVASPASPLVQAYDEHLPVGQLSEISRI